MTSQDSFEDKIFELKKAWEDFIKTGKINKSVVRPIVANSWKRCRSRGLDPYSKKDLYILNDQEIKALLERNRQLINISESILKLINKMIQGSGFRVDLIDKDGYFIKSYCDEELLKKSIKLGSIIGANRSESMAGTNSMAITLLTGEPIQITGPEHYNILNHSWTCSAAAIKGSFGNTIGAVNITGDYTLMHKHTLGMVVSIANTIESEIKTKEKIYQLDVSNKFFKTLIEYLDDGLIVIDDQGIITNINQIAENILGQKKSIIGVQISKLIETNFSFFNLLNQRKEYIEKHVVITKDITKEKIPCLLSAKLINDYQGQSKGAVILLKEMKKVHRLVGNIIGANPRYCFSDVIGNNAKLIKTINLAKVASVSSCKILIQGESGTGKEIFAQAIHNNSPRKNKPFLAINCGAIPRDLVESELLGYESGAFTGAKKEGKPGKFELAEGGTLFLDEIESMPLEAQPKLLRVLESNQLMRVGGNKFMPFDVRIISSSNEDLFSLSKKGKFREDLYYRLNTVTIKIPPLRERKDDIPILIKHFYDRLKNNVDCEIEIDREVLELFYKYDWPGNVRELENEMERLILLSDNNKIMADLISENITQFKKNHPKIDEKNQSFSFIEIEKGALLKTLKDVNGNISKASKRLGIDRSTIYRKMKKYNIEK